MLSTQDPNWIPALRADGTTLPEQTCTPRAVGSCLVGSGPGGENQATLTGLAAKTLTLGLLCTAPAGQQCITGAEGFHAAVATMYSATITIADPTPPTLNTPTGPLWEPDYHKGTENLTVSAQDTGGGIQTITLLTDGHPAATYNPPCNFTYPKPCPTSTEEQTLTLNTTNLTDGHHTLTLLATDAADNTSTIASTEILTANDPPPPPTNLVATQTPPGSSTFTATWNNPTNPALPITAATYQICPTNGTDACTAPTEAPATGPATVTVPSPGIWTLALWLTNAAGNSSPTQAAHTTLVVMPAGTTGLVGGGSPTSGSGGGNGSTNTSGPHTTGSTRSKAKIHVTETLSGRKLLVHIKGSTTGKVRVNFTAKLHSRVVASSAKSVALRHGLAAATFTLGPRTAARAVIRVSAKLDHEPAVTSTLHRTACRPDSCDHDLREARGGVW